MNFRDTTNDVLCPKYYWGYALHEQEVRYVTFHLCKAGAFTEKFILFSSFSPFTLASRLELPGPTWWPLVTGAYHALEWWLVSIAV